MRLNTDYNSLTRALLSGRDLSPGHVRDLVARFPQSHGVIGELPDALLGDVSQVQKPTMMQSILDGLARIQRALRGEQKIECWDEKRSTVTFASDETLEKAGRILKDIFRPTKTSDLTKKGRGAFGAVYGFNVNGEGYVLKSFLPDSVYRRDYGFDGARDNGIYSEAPMGAYWHKNAPESQFDTMHFADLNEGYMVSKDVDILPPPKNLVDIDSFGIIDVDPPTQAGENVKNGYKFDFGGQVVKYPVLTFNPIARVAYSEVKKTPETKRLAKLLEMSNRAGVNQDDTYAGLHLVLKTLPSEDAKKVPFGIKIKLLTSYLKIRLEA